MTVIIGGGHVHCGQIVDGSYEQLVDDLYACLVEDDPLTWDRYFKQPEEEANHDTP